ncbi:rhamnosyltransferase [Croceibacterium mercuriale]|uniref:Rhamnosyltransferase n=1 Tax=Croceibacterium mercuriale TaxID=1572751 RepID=A0A0B2BY24_9SPHN|nr:ferritin-like domain-containing protein [Croceibacterium mercuriale]KHL24912.1 rhamnosyltransferase [Croceibacterium mercuriale]
MTQSVSAAIAAALLTGEPRDKVMQVRALARAWRKGTLAWDWAVPMPDRPAVPPGLQLLPPGQMPRRRKGGSEATRVALWHSLAHIEFMAIDLALDAAGRFGEAQGPDFVSDFLAVAADEAMHWSLIARKLRTLDSHYAALPAHDGLWEAADATKGDVAARLAVVPMVLEARGLDVTPAARDRIRASGDEGGARILQRILDDEIRHVAVGAKHFAQVAQRRGESYENYWEMLVRQHFHGTLKPPFNDSARQAAGLPRRVYVALA